jgi:transcriptional regulator with XRE-family HTH domain
LTNYLVDVNDFMTVFSGFSQMSLGDRLREVREEMGLSQTELAEIGGVIRNTQGSYERGERMPDTGYMQKIGEAGADIIYILTGIRATALGPMLSPEEQTLLDNFRACEEIDRNAIGQLVKRSAEAVQRTRSRVRPGNPQGAQAA